MRERYLTVIWNAEGLIEYDINGEDSDNITTYMLPEPEFDELCEKGIFKSINGKCGLLIDDYESEIINKTYLKKCLQIVSESIKTGVFLDALGKACEKGIAVGLDF